MKRESKFEIITSEPGVLVHRQGCIEYRFPIYEEDGEIVFVAWPSSQRIFLFFLSGGWTRVPREFSTRDRERIVAQVIRYFRQRETSVRVLTYADQEEFQFHPELFEYRTRASDLLDTAGFAWFSNYSSIDLMHEEFGLEVCGIQDESNVEAIARAMRAGFPQWHYGRACYKDYGREPGWRFALHMFPRRCGGGCSG